MNFAHKTLLAAMLLAGITLLALAYWPWGVQAAECQYTVADVINTAPPDATLVVITDPKAVAGMIETLRSKYHATTPDTATRIVGAVWKGDSYFAFEVNGCMTDPLKLAGQMS